MYLDDWKNFQLDLLNMGADSTLEEAFYCLKSWFSLNIKKYNSKSIKDYRLEEKFGLNYSNYSMGGAEYSFKDFKNQCLKFNPNDLDSLCMFLRDVLAEMLVYRVQKQCPNDCNSDLVAMYDPCKNAVLLMCDQCDWLEDTSGCEARPESLLEFASNEQIARAGI